MTYWMLWVRTIRDVTYRVATRVVVDRGTVTDAGDGLERFVGRSWESVRYELTKAGWLVLQD